MLKINEVFGPTIQGEGKYIGTPSFFIRTAGCNLRCAWKDSNNNIITCDTPYTSFYLDNVEIFDLDYFKKQYLAKYPNINHIVITGGEPMLQHDKILDLVKKLNSYYITIETNCTIYNYHLTQMINVFFSFSPKLSNSYFAENKKDKNMHIKNNKNWTETFIKFYKSFDSPSKYQLKFVVNNKNDILEINEKLKPVAIDPKNIYLMPMGITKEELNYNLNLVLEAAYKYGYNLTDRLHIKLWNNKRGV